MITFTKKELKRLQLLGYIRLNSISSNDLSSNFQRPIVGHVGDGNFHVLLLIDPKNQDEIKRVHEFATLLAKYEMIGLVFIISIYL
jgi:FAD/FMN-containing dehydrogenase